MEVLRVGTVPTADEWGKTVLCKGKKRFVGDLQACGALFKIVSGDLRHYYWENYVEGGKVHYVAAKCPLCGKLTEIENVPEPIEEAVFEKRGSYHLPT